MKTAKKSRHIISATNKKPQQLKFLPPYDTPYVAFFLIFRKEAHRTQKNVSANKSDKVLPSEATMELGVWRGMQMQIKKRKWGFNGFPGAW